MLLKGLKCERKSRCTEIKEIKICDTFAETCLFSIYDTLHVYDSAWSSKLGEEKGVLHFIKARLSARHADAHETYRGFCSSDELSLS